MSEKSEGLDRVSRMERTTQKTGNSGAAWRKSNGPANGGSTAGNPTKDSKIKRG